MLPSAKAPARAQGGGQSREKRGRWLGVALAPLTLLLDLARARVGAHARHDGSYGARVRRGSFPAQPSFVGSCRCGHCHDIAYRCAAAELDAAQRWVRNHGLHDGGQRASIGRSLLSRETALVRPRANVGKRHAAGLLHHPRGWMRLHGGDDSWQCAGFEGRLPAGRRVSERRPPAADGLHDPRVRSVLHERGHRILNGHCNDALA